MRHCMLWFTVIYTVSEIKSNVN